MDPHNSQGEQPQGPADPAPSRKKGRAYASQAYDIGRSGSAAPNGQYGGGPPQTSMGQAAGYQGGAAYGQGQAQAPPGAPQQYGYGQQPPIQQGYAPPDQDYQPPQHYGGDQGYNQLNDRFEQMGLQSNQQQFQQPYPAAQQMPMNRLIPSDLVNQPFNVAELDQPPPPIILPPNSSVTGSPHSNAPPKYIRCTLNTVPTTHSLLNKSKLPFALVINPYNSLHDSEDPVPLVSDQVISRCRRCRSYINPYAIFLDHGRRWRCNMCNLTNDVPQAFDYDPEAKQSVERMNRAELNYSVVEFVAPQEYMIRPPQPLVYLFLIDVSNNSIASGLLATVARTILESLPRIPNADRRTRLGFIAVDTSLHYFQVPRDDAEGAETTMLVVSDVTGEPFTPIPGDLLVTLSEHQRNIEKFLEKLPVMFQSPHVGSCMGSALKAAKNLISAIGGKVIVLTATLPNVGDGELKMREDKKVLGTSKEGALLQTANNFYKSFAVDCSKLQVSVDMFLFSSTYQDVASLSCLPRYTGGQTYFYPGWNAARSEDMVKFMKEFSDFLSSEIGLEAVMRVRASAGLRMSGFYGNFFNRSSDLCAFPAFPRDQGYVVEVAIDETLNKGYICMQTAVLHTTCNGERRIRVLTLSLPTTQNLSEVYASADPVAIATYYSHKAVERALGGNLDGAREILEAKIIELLRVYRKEMAGGSVGGGGVQFPSNLRSLPVLFLALLKNVGLRKSALIPSDLRSAALCLLSTLPSPALMQFIYPKLYNIHEMPDSAGLPDPTTGEIELPPPLNLSSSNFAPYGLYLLTDGQTQFLWVGGQAVPQLIQDVFGMQDVSQVRFGKQEMPVVDSDFNERVRAVIEKSRDARTLSVGSIVSPSLYIVREDGDPSLRLWAQTLLVEDRADQGMSLQQWMGNLREKVIQ